jgi:predicted nuclease of predicted toxin-antitoxin system
VRDLGLRDEEDEKIFFAAREADAIGTAPDRPRRLGKG